MTYLCLFQDLFPKTKLAGLTATVTKMLRAEIIESLGLLRFLLRFLQTEADQIATFHYDMLIEILRPHSLF